MGRHEDPTTTITNPNVYPEELQIKLYQAFIFSIPILFSIILFLLFYLFYLKRRAANHNNNNNNNSNSNMTSISAMNHHSVSFVSPAWNINMGIKEGGGDLKDKLQLVLFDQQLKAKDSLCCVCLGEFEMEEELRQLPLCKHVFHGDCIRHWLRTNATCPLCRCPLISAIKMGHPIGLITTQSHHVSSNTTAQQEDDNTTVSRSDGDDFSRPNEHVIHISQEPSSSNNVTS